MIGDLLGDTGVGRIDSERGRKRSQMVLLINQDAPKTFCNRELIQEVSLPDAAALVTDGLFFILQVSDDARRDRSVE